MDMEWIERETSFGDTSGKRSIYMITDHFIHFWYRFVSTLASELEFQDTGDVYKSRVEPYLNDCVSIAIMSPCNCKGNMSPL
jgi:hypothetical protein